MPISKPFREVVMRHRAVPLLSALAIVAGLLLVASPGWAAAPVAVNDGYQKTVGTGPVVVALPGVLVNDTDADGDALTVYTVNGATGNVGIPVALASGSVTVNANGSLTYTPVAGFTGTVTFTYTAWDGTTASNAATVTIAIQPVVPAINALVRPVCVNESNGLLNNCTANDLTFVELGLGTQTDGCVNSRDRVSIFLRGVVRNATAQTRYDVGMWFPTPYSGTNPLYLDDPLWGAKIDPEGDGAYTGDCGAVGLMNPEPSPPTNLCYFDTTPGVLDLPGTKYALPGTEVGHGPWVNDDGGNWDGCGDLYDNGHKPGCDANGDGSWDDSVVIFDSTLDLDCKDLDGNGQVDGFVNTSVCLTWGNQANQVDNTGDAKCMAQSELMPGTKSKCRCEQFQLTNVPSPEISLSCALPVDGAGNPLPTYTIEPGGFIRLAVTYTNSCTCTPNPATKERFRCCTASYLEFPITFDNTLGTVTPDSDPPPGWTLTGTVDWDYAPNTIIWRPTSTANGLVNGEGIIAQGETETLYFLFHVTDPLPVGTPLPVDPQVNLGARWANAIDYQGNFVDPRNQIALTGTCTFNVNSTWANVSGPTADVRDGRAVVSWETSAEVGTVGFDVFRSDGSADGWVKVNETLVPAIGDGPGGRYELVDDGAATEGTVTYKVREVDLRGRELETRPVTVELREVAAPAPRNGSTAEPRQASRRMTKAGEGRAGRAAKDAAVRQGPSSGRVVAERPTLVKIGVAETGLYRVTTADIAAAVGETSSRISTRIGQHKLALTTGGQPVAWKAEPNGTGILFFGEAPDSIYDAERPYVLRLEKGLAIEEAGQSPSQPETAFGSFADTVVFEHDLMLRPFNVFDEDADYWFWDAVLAGDGSFGERSLEIELEGVAAPTTPAGLLVSFVGFAPGPEVSALLFVNDHYVGELYGPILERTDAVFGLDQGYLTEGSNTIKITGRKGGMLIDRVEVSYDRRLSTSAGQLIVRNPGAELVSVGGFATSDVKVFDITDPLRPAELAVSTAAYAGATSIAVGFAPTSDAGTYLVVSGGAIRQPASITGRAKSELRGNQLGAEYLIITTSELKATADRLAAHRRDKGLEAMVVDVEDIFDDFAFGSRDPGAINAFLAYAADTWTKPPRYVLLAGRGHYDYKNLLGYGGGLVPPMLAVTEQGLIPSDNKLADLDGDGLPDLAVGRLPVLNARELGEAIDKIIAYDAEEPGQWAKQVMLVVDDPDEAGDFTKSGDTLALAVPVDREVEKVYLFDPYTASEVNALMMGALDEGIGIVNWTGHAGLDALANERVLTNADLGSLEVTSHPSVVVGLTCLINNFGFPYFATLGEELSLLPGGGAVGVWAASGLSNNAYAEVLGEKFMAALDGRAPHRLGDIILSAIQDYAGSRVDRNLVNEYVLFGDPAVEFK